MIVIVVIILLFISLFVEHYCLLYNRSVKTGGSISKLLTVVNDIPAQIPYGSAPEQTRALHFGQLKLLISEIEFIDSLPPGPKTILYAGSAPNNKLPILLDLYPDVTFVLADPHKHYFGEDFFTHRINEVCYFVLAPESDYAKADEGKNSKVEKKYNLNGVITHRTDRKQGEVPTDINNKLHTYKVFVIEDFFTNELAERLKVDYYISDIRTQSEEYPSELDILNDNAQSYNIIKRLQPKKYMIKFRTPYFYGAPVRETEELNLCPVPLLTNYNNKKFEFLKGELWLQAFAGQSSTESRLVGTTLDTTEYDIDWYNNSFYFFNKKYRGYNGPNVNSIVDRSLGICECQDCALMMDVLTNNRSIEKAKSIVREVCRLTNRKLYKHH